MTPEQIQHYDAAFKTDNQPARPDRRRIFAHKGTTCIPASLKSPLLAAELEPYLNTDELITFTIRAPVSSVENGIEVLAEFVTAMAFAEPVMLRDFSASAVGSAYDDVDEPGNLYLQVFCKIRSIG